ncbi:MAG: hypothetical protein RLY97_2241 [Pseudomonadota bacterium]|jgi:hypothetical protein
MKSALFISLSLLVSLPNVAIAAETSATGTATPKEKKICRADVNTGSIMPKRTCHTKAEWEALDRQNSSAAGKTIDGQERGLGNNGGNVPVS